MRDRRRSLSTPASLAPAPPAACKSAPHWPQAIALVARIEQTRLSLVELQSRLGEGGGVGGGEGGGALQSSFVPSWSGGDGYSAHRVEARRRARRQAPARLREGSLRERTDMLRGMLLRRGLDEATRCLPSRLGLYCAPP